LCVPFPSIWNDSFVAEPEAVTSFARMALILHS
jgi:hypothetical protein